MKKTLFAPLMMLTALGILISCRKTDNSGGGTPQPGPIVYKKVKKIVAGPNDFVSYEYTPEKEVKRYQSSWTYSPDGSIATYSANYTYENGRIREVENGGGGKQVIAYQNNQISHADFFNQRGVKYSTHHYSFNALGQLTEVVETITDPLQVSHVRIRFEYNQQGNLSKRMNDQKLVGEEVYKISSISFFDTYDSKWNPIPAEVWGQHLPSLVMQKNNPLKVREVLPDGSIRQIMHMTYQYAEDGYPKSKDQHLEVNGEHRPSYRLQYEY